MQWQQQTACFLRVTSGLDKVQASMYAIVNDLLAINTVFLLEIRVKSRLDVFNDRPPAG
jgi:hypothetical protein